MLKAIRLKGCQSWDDVTIEFSCSKPNILVADNNAGKSVLFKMLKITANPKIYSTDERKYLIRYGSDSAIIIYLFDDGFIGMTIVYTNRVLYRIKECDTEDFVTYSDPPSTLLEHLSLLVNSQTDFIANIIDTDQDLFLVNTKSSSNVEYLRLLAEEPTLREVLEKIDQETIVLKENNKVLATLKTSLEISLDGYKYVDVDKLQGEIDKSNALLEVLIVLLKLYEHIEKMNSCIKDYTDYSELLCSMDIVESLKDMKQLLHKLTYDKTDYSADLLIIDYIVQLQVINNLLSKVCIDSVELSIYFTVIDICTLLSSINSYLNTVKECTKKSEILSSEIDRLHCEINSSGFVIQCPIKGEVLYIDEECLPYRH